MNSGTQDFIARVDPRSSYSMDSREQMVFDMSNMHIFDKETEAAVR
jgi:hypothetical protein